MNSSHLREKLIHITQKHEGEFRVVVVAGGERIDIRGNEVVTSASLIKIPVLLAACQMADEERISLDQVIPIPPEEKVGGCGVLSRLSDGLSLPLRDLLTLMMIVSDNTASNLCIDAVGIGNINELLASLCCTGTSIGRRLMDLEARKAGKDNFVTANDLVRMMKALCEENLLKEESRHWAVSVFHSQQFNHKLPRLIPSGVPGDAFIAHKTGELPGVEHDAGFIERGSRRAYVVVLTTNLSSNVSGQEAIGEIGKAVWDYLE